MITLATRLSLIVFAALATLTLSGCNLALLHPKGTIADNETRILIEAFLIMLVVVIPAILLTFFFAYRYSTKRENAKYSPGWTHSNLLELIWWAIPCVIIIILATITWVSTHQLSPYKPLKSKVKPITIQAISLNWKWLFVYPDQHIATLNTLTFPVKTPISFEITADGPMNSLQIIQLAGQIYSMAGMRTRLHMIANQTGPYRGLSTNFSGPGFADMHFIAHVVSKKQFKAWVTGVQHSPKTLTRAEFLKLRHNSKDVPPAVYSHVMDKLFKFEMDLFLKPQLKSLQKAALHKAITVNGKNHHA